MVEENIKPPAADNQEKKDKKASLPLPIILAFGCLGVLVIGTIVISIAGKILFSRLGTGLIQKGIETKTGIKVETESGNEGFSFTDTKTGTKINLGAQQIPPDFPPDFPLYPGAKPSGSLSGDKTGESGFWLVLSTSDSLEKVENYYSDKISSWGGKDILRIGNTVTWQLENDTYKGSLTVSREKDDKDTQIMIILSNGSEKQ